MFKNQSAPSTLSDNKNELTWRRQNGDVMVAVKDEFSKHVTSTDVESTGLGRWNHVDADNGVNNPRFESVLQSVRST